MGPAKGVMIGFSFLYYMFPNSKMSQKIPTMGFANLFSGNAPSQVQCLVDSGYLEPTITSRYLDVAYI